MSVRLPVSLSAYRLLTRAATPLANHFLKRRLAKGKELEPRIAERRGRTAR